MFSYILFLNSSRKSKLQKCEILIASICILKNWTFCRKSPGGSDWTSKCSYSYKIWQNLLPVIIRNSFRKTTSGKYTASVWKILCKNIFLKHSSKNLNDDTCAHFRWQIGLIYLLLKFKITIHILIKKNINPLPVKINFIVPFLKFSVYSVCLFESISLWCRM